MSPPTGAPLARRILRAHADAARGPSSAALRPVHAVAGEDAGALALAALDRLGAPRAAVDLALLAADRRGPTPGFEDADVVTALRGRALARGIHFARPGAGPAGDAYLERAAAPGRLAFASGTAAHAAGALGALVIDVDAVEWAVALAGLALDTGPRAWAEVALLGELPAGAVGWDAAAALDARAAGGLRDAGVEFGGPGAAALGLADRFALARGTGAAGAASVLFPSDATVRECLRAWGREADWRALEPQERERAPAFTLDLGAVEPMAAPEGRSAAARPLRDWSGAPVARVDVGRDASLDDLARLAARLAGREVARGVRVTIAPAGRALLECAETLGILGTLRAAGVAVGPGGAPGEPAAPGLVLACGGAPGPAEGAWIAVGLEAAAAAARLGRVADPREAATGWDPLVRPVVTSGAWIETPRDTDAAGGGPDPLPSAAPPGAALRGELLFRAFGPLGPADLLPGGARLEPLRAQVGALAEWALSGVEPGFAARARARGGGFVAAGPGFGAGPGDGERAALALAALGVRAVLARGFDPAFRRRLVRAGVLPLRLERAADLAAVEPGDGLEVPGLAEALGADRPVTVRNLTRGTRVLARHELGPDEVALARAGGLLGWAAARVAAEVR